MTQKSKQAAGFLAVCILLFPICGTLFGCVPFSKDSRPLLWYGASSFPFEITLFPNDAEGEPMLLRGERTPTAVTLTAVSPERLNGLAVSYENGNCTLSAGETAIPLSKRAAEGLTRLLDALLFSSAEGAVIGSAEDGKPTVTFDALTLTLDENGLPAAILDEKTGRRAAISVLPEDVTN